MEEMAERTGNPRRLLLRDFLSLDQCKELEFIHKSSSTVGYRPNVFSTTLSHLIATNCPQLIVPLVPLREKLKDKVEEFFGWSKGASIGWHSDDNRPYLKQRDYTAVCYLNTHGRSFSGGLFHFQDGEPKTVVPSAGDLLMYTADSRNIHAVDEGQQKCRSMKVFIIDMVTGGERLTLTLWFSRNSTHDEDVKLISRLSQICSTAGSSEPLSSLPAPASSNMYLFSRDQSSHQELGINVCFARILVLGFSIYSSHAENDLSEPCDLLLKPLQLTRGDELFSYEFSNILHALQVVQYYFSKSSGLPSPKSELGPGKIAKLSHPQRERVDDLKHFLVKDHKLPWEIFDFTSHEGAGLLDFNWAYFSAAVSAWEDYTSEKHKELLLSMPQWKSHQSMFCVSFGGP
ncbi:uncharacterized protein LOC116201504 isoform X2 [Punica granatum]|uniref:Uncharacterized protein LOC116201504 isoform X2 n=1 Tax=Punica granatum TaxID=22663 RepID=A0A6P8CWY8_PUNGR|nr:uncharacterized protein LOC116201504 isoform X2 [Punica granatum]